MSKYLLSFFFLVFTVNAFAASRTQCGAMKSKYVPGRIGYCAMLPPSYDGHPGKRFTVCFQVSADVCVSGGAHAGAAGRVAARIVRCGAGRVSGKRIWLSAE